MYSFYLGCYFTYRSYESHFLNDNNILVLKKRIHEIKQIILGLYSKHIGNLKESFQKVHIIGSVLRKELRQKRLHIAQTESQIEK